MNAIIPASLNMLYKKRKFALRLAHAIKKRTGMSWGEAQKLAWANLRLYLSLYGGNFISFSYKKKSGEQRKAIGTRNVKIIPNQKQAKNSAGISLSVIKYFDFEKNNWRSFKPELLIA